MDLITERYLESWVRNGLSLSLAGINVRERGYMISASISTGLPLGNSRSLPCTVAYQRNSPGLAGLGCLGASHASQCLTTQEPDSSNGGLPPTMPRTRCLASVVRFHPHMNTY